MGIDWVFRPSGLEYVPVATFVNTERHLQILKRRRPLASKSEPAPRN
jgi:hypothetical protein